MIDIVIIKSNSIIYDHGVTKIVKSLSKSYSTLALGWNREGISIKTANNYIANLQLLNLKAPIGKPHLVAYFPFFWIWILFKLLVYRPKVVHACDLDTILPCYIYKIIFRKRLVFSVYDRYAMGYIPLILEPGSIKYKVLYSLANLFEELFSKKSDVLINVSEELLRTFRRKPKYCAIIMNCPEDHAIDRVKSEDDDVLTLVYTGPIMRNRGLDRIIAAIQDLNNVELVIAGRVIDKELLDKILETSNVDYKGLLPLSDALALEGSSDTMIILYDLKHEINNFAMPNKLFESMMFGLPIITNVAPEVVKKVDCGIIVDYNNISQIKSAVISLRNNIDLRRRLGYNGRKAFIQKYNWTIMEQELYKIYKNLLGE